MVLSTYGYGRAGAHFFNSVAPNTRFFIFGCECRRLSKAYALENGASVNAVAMYPDGAKLIWVDPDTPVALASPVGFMKPGTPVIRLFSLAKKPAVPLVEETAYREGNNVEQANAVTLHAPMILLYLPNLEEELSRTLAL